MHSKITLAVVVAVGTLSTAAFAQTAQEQQLCMDDAFKVCGHTIPDRGRTIACMVQNKSRLSTACQMVMDKYAPGGNVQTAAVSPARPAVSTRPAAMRTAQSTRPGRPLNILMR